MKKTRTRLFSILLAVCVLCTALSVSGIPALASEKADIYVVIKTRGYYQITYERDGDGSYTLTELYLTSSEYAQKGLTYSYNSYVYPGYNLYYYSDPACTQKLDYSPISENVALNLEIWLKGDVTCDGSVDIIDFVHCKKLLSGGGIPGGEPQGDMNGDGIINADDLLHMKKGLLGML